MFRQADMQAGRQAYGLASRRLFSGENDVFASTCVSWTLTVLVHVCEGLQALLQNTPDMPLRRQPMMFAMLPCIVLDDAAEHASLLESLAHQLKCGAVEPKSLAHVVSVLTRAHCLFRLNEVTRVQSHLSTQLYSAATLQDFPLSGSA